MTTPQRNRLRRVRNTRQPTIFKTFGRWWVLIPMEKLDTVQGDRTSKFVADLNDRLGVQDSAPPTAYW